MLLRFSLSLIASLSLTVAGRADFQPSEEGLYVHFETSMGEFTAKLYHEQMPLTVRNFAGLAENGVISFDNGIEESLTGPFFDGTGFHQVFDGQRIHGGIPKGQDGGDPGYIFPDELRPSLSHDRAGLLSMLNDGPNTNGSQYFITLGPNTQLDDHNAIFGEIVEGMNIVELIGKVPVDISNGEPITPITVNRAEIIRKGHSARSFQTHQAVRTGEDVQIYKNINSPYTFDLNTAPARITLEVDDRFEYYFRKSSDLVNWDNYSQILRLSDTPTTRTHSINLPTKDAPKTFFLHARNAFIPPFDLVDRQIEFNLGEAYGDFVVKMGENADGEFSQDWNGEASNGTVIYDYIDLERYDQLYIIFFYAENEFFEIQIYLPDGSPLEETAKTVITDSFPGFMNQTIAMDYIIRQTP